MAPRVALLFLLTLPFTPVVAAITYTNQFRDWYPQYSTAFERIKNDHCSAEYERYITGNYSYGHIDPVAGSGPSSVLTSPVINCILNHTSDYIKNGMTSAQVLLGIMPTVLALLGPSSEEMSMLSNVAHRPLLALLLAAGSPSVYFSRAFEYHDVSDILRDHPSRLPQWRPEKWYSLAVISSLEYLVALSAVTNIVVMNWELGVKTICNFWTNGIFPSTVWVVMGLITHFGGTVVLRLRLCGWRGRDRQQVRRDAEERIQREKARILGSGQRQQHAAQHHGEWREKKGSRNIMVTAFRWCAGIPMASHKLLVTTEFIPAAAEGYDVRIVTFMETKTFLVAAWVLSIWTVLHIVYGTLVFASTTFIGVRDSVIILARYIVSVACCRIVLMYELAGLRESCIRPIVAVTSRRLRTEQDASAGLRMSVDSLNMGMHVSTMREDPPSKDRITVAIESNSIS